MSATKFPGNHLTNQDDVIDYIFYFELGRDRADRAIADYRSGAVRDIREHTTMLTNIVGLRDAGIEGWQHGTRMAIRSARFAGYITPEYYAELYPDADTFEFPWA